MVSQNQQRRNRTVKCRRSMVFSTESCTEAENHGTSILLQTAVVRAVNPDDPNKSANSHAVLDSGSQRTYITKNAGEIFKLTTVSKENVI